MSEAKHSAPESYRNTTPATHSKYQTSSDASPKPGWANYPHASSELVSWLKKNHDSLGAKYSF